MRRAPYCLIIVGIIASISAQEIQHEAVAINIEVPVRVFQGDTFKKTRGYIYIRSKMFKDNV